MHETDFAAALTAVQQGDEASFVVLFRSVQPGLLRYLRTIAPALADDVAAETWLAVVRGLPRFRGDEQGWRAWVFTIARAKLADARREVLRAPTVVDSDAALAGVADAADVASAVEELITTEAALALIGRLPREQAEIVLLRHVAGLSVERTAQVLGKRAGAVRVGAHRGLRRLADLLKDSDGVTVSGRVAISE